jgi:hypothetical protein
MVRDEFGSWIPCAHFFTRWQEGGVVAECLKQLRLWCEGEGGWNLRYFLTDDLAAKQEGFHDRVSGHESDCSMSPLHRTLKENASEEFRQVPRFAAYDYGFRQPPL